jgi:cell division initiation protein
MITPLEIKEKRFQAGLTGFRKREVIDFLDLLSTEFQVVLKENRELRQQLEMEKEKQKELLDRESMIKNVLVTAQDSSEKVRQNADREAELMIKEAELRAEKILGGVQQEKDRILRQIEDLNASYRQYKAKMQSVLTMYSELLKEDDTTSTVSS